MGQLLEIVSKHFLQTGANSLPFPPGAGPSFQSSNNENGWGSSPFSQSQGHLFAATQRKITGTEESLPLIFIRPHRI
jgi:hypothetical protein